MKNSRKNKNKFTGAHFPVGTRVIICFDHSHGDIPRKTPFEATVTKLYRDRLHRYVIETNLKGTVTEFLSCSITWVESIIERGPGLWRIEDHDDGEALAKFRKRLDTELLELGMTKHKNYYITTHPLDLVATVAYPMLSIDMLMDFDLLMKMLMEQNVWTLIARDGENEWYNSIYKVQKKKLRAAVKRMLPRCLSRIEVEQRLDDEENACSFERDWEDDFGGLDPKDELTEAQKKELVDNRDRIAEGVNHFWPEDNDEDDDPIHGLEDIIDPL